MPPAFDRDRRNAVRAFDAPTEAGPKPAPRAAWTERDHLERFRLALATCCPGLYVRHVVINGRAALRAVHGGLDEHIVWSEPSGFYQWVSSGRPVFTRTGDVAAARAVARHMGFVGQER